MQEMIVSYILVKENEKPKNRLSRIILSACIATKKENYTTCLSIHEQEKQNFVDEENRLKEKFYGCESVKKISDCYNS